MKRRNSFVLLAVIVIAALTTVIGGCGVGGADGGSNPPVLDNPPPGNGREQPRDVPEAEFYSLAKDGRLGKIFRNTVNTVDEAIYELNNVKTILGLSDPVAELSGDVAMRDSLGRVYRLKQYYKGIPVDGKEIRVFVNHEGRVTDLVSNYKRIWDNFNVTPSITSGDAEGIARRAAESEITSAGLDPGEFDIITASQLVVYAIGERELDPVLAWRVKTRVQYGTVLNTDYYIDQRGQIIDEITNIRTVAVGAQGGRRAGRQSKFYSRQDCRGQI